MADERPLKLVCKVIHKGRQVAIETAEMNDDVLEYKNERLFILESKFQEVAIKTLNALLKDYDETHAES